MKIKPNVLAVAKMYQMLMTGANVPDIEYETGLRKETVYSHIAHMRHLGIAHVAAWNGAHQVFKLGGGEDAGRKIGIRQTQQLAANKRKQNDISGT